MALDLAVQNFMSFVLQVVITLDSYFIGFKA